MKRPKRLQILIILQLVFLFGYSCAPNLEKMIPEDRAFDFESTDKSINVSGGLQSSKKEHREGKASIGSLELKTVLVESIKKSNIFVKVSSDDTTNTSDYQLSAWIIHQSADNERASITIEYHIDGKELHFEKTIHASYNRHENYWSPSTGSKTLEHVVRKNMEKLLVELYLLLKRQNK